MRIYTIILFVLVTLNAGAFPIFTIIGHSWSDSSFVSYGSKQWIDVTDDLKNGWSTSDRADVYLFNTATNGTGSPIYLKLAQMLYDKTVTYNQVWHPGSPGYWENTPIDSSGFLSLPLNGDGKSRRIYLTMPQSFPSGHFTVNVDLQANSVPGIFASPNAIEEYSAQKQIKQISYYNLMGQPIEAPSEGVFIRETTYTDGLIQRKKIHTLGF